MRIQGYYLYLGGLGLLGLITTLATFVTIQAQSNEPVQLPPPLRTSEPPQGNNDLFFRSTDTLPRTKEAPPLAKDPKDPKDRKDRKDPPMQNPPIRITEPGSTKESKGSIEGSTQPPTLLPAPLPSLTPVDPSRFSAKPGGEQRMREALEKLTTTRKELEQLRKEIATEIHQPLSDDKTRIALRLQVTELIRKLNEKDRPRPLPLPEPQKKPTPAPVVEAPKELVAPQDPLGLAQSQFRAKEYESALKTLNTISPTKDRLWVQYLKASCLQRLGKPNEAAVLFREVAANREDEFLRETAQEHLKSISWTQEIERQLEQMRRKGP